MCSFCTDIRSHTRVTDQGRELRIPYASLVHTFTLIDATTKRLEITKYLSQYLMQVITRTPNELIKIIYLCINRVESYLWSMYKGFQTPRLEICQKGEAER